MAHDPMIELDFYKMGHSEILDVLRGSSRLSQIRRIMSSSTARIEQSQQQRKPLSPIDVRRLEFQGAQEILRLFEEDV